MDHFAGLLVHTEAVASVHSAALEALVIGLQVDERAHARDRRERLVLVDPFLADLLSPRDQVGLLNERVQPRHAAPFEEQIELVASRRGRADLLSQQLDPRLGPLDRLRRESVDLFGARLRDRERLQFNACGFVLDSFGGLRFHVWFPFFV